MKALVVGAGFSGMTAAVVLAEQGYRVFVLEARDHLGGNAYDCVDDETGVRYHPYGPHLFHTNSAKVVAFLSRFTAWTPYVHRVRSVTPFGLLDFPINRNTLNAMFPGALSATATEAEVLALLKRLGLQSVANPDDLSMSGVMRRLVGDLLFETFYDGYSLKQWGRPTTKLPAPIAKRVPVRADFSNTYFDDQFQALPMHGYTAMFEAMASVPGVEVTLGVKLPPEDVLSALKHYDRVVYTGPIDELFGHQLGRLEYRSLRFEWRRGDCPTTMDVVTNYPSASVMWTRETEYGLLPNSPAVGRSLVGREFPTSEGDPYYPLPDGRNRDLYHEYRKMADHDKLQLIGRLAEYRYYNMDQAVASAMAKVGGAS